MERYATDVQTTRPIGSWPWVAWLALTAAMLSHNWLLTTNWHAKHGEASSCSKNTTAIDSSVGITIDLNRGAGRLEFPALRCVGRFQELVCWSRSLSRNEQATLAAFVPPLFIALATYLASNSALLGALAAWLTIGSWWMRPNVEQWDHHLWETTMIGSVAGLYFGGLIRFHRLPGACGWLAMVAASMLGWSLFPVPWALFFFPATAAWLLVAYRHGWLWHVWLILALVFAAAPFYPRWFELSRHWPTIVEMGTEVLATAWPSTVGQPATVAAVSAIQIGMMIMPCAARAKHAASAVLLVAVVTSLVVIGLTQPSAKSFGDAVRCSWVWPGIERGSSVTQIEAAPVITLSNTSRMLVEVGGMDRLQCRVDLNIGQTPVVTGLAGQDETIPWNLANGRLAGRLISEVSDEELRRLVDRWNIGSIWTADRATIERLRRWPIAKSPIELGGGQWFPLDRMARYILKGHAIWSPQTNGDILLTDVMPEQGELVLSLRYYRNWAAGPGHVSVEPEIDPYDPLPIVRLKLQDPVSRILLRLSR